MTDSLAPLGKPPFTGAVEALEKLMSHSGRAFLMGAGCSLCAGLPLTVSLTEEVLNNPSLQDLTKDILSVLTKQFEGSTSATIEDYMSGEKSLGSGTGNSVLIDDIGIGSSIGNSVLRTAETFRKDDNRAVGVGVFDFS